MAKYKQNVPNPTTVAWLAIIISSLALIMSMLVYSQLRGFSNLGKDIKTSVVSVEQQKAVKTAMQKLEELRAGVSSGAIPVSQVQSRLTQIRYDLSLAFQNAGEGAQKVWETIDAGFTTIGGAIKNGSVAVLDALDAAILALKNLII